MLLCEVASLHVCECDIKEDEIQLILGSGRH